ncbi:MAG: hypothetical protein HUU55_15050 [Myxococcales bacterium]|nr:hypothetical protein [Myxococcales bacterium]
MKRKTRILTAATLTTILGFSGLTSVVRGATPLGGADVPFVLIALDTSGSMEYLDGTESAVPTCDALGTLKNRWALTMEALTGSFPPFNCTLDDRSSPPNREDYGYPIPHVVYQLQGQQAPNGLLDNIAGIAHVALMTFDNHYGTELTAAGGWSYGPKVVAATPGLGEINLGARNLAAQKNVAAGGSFTGGGLVPFFNPANPTELVPISKVEDAVRNRIPHDGTPIAPLLMDIKEYFANDPSLQPLNPVTGVGDPYYSCRQRDVILITDGIPSMGEGDGYPLSPKAAAMLHASHPMGIRTFVVGFSLSPDLDPQALEVLDAIAKAGDPGNPNAHAYLANNQAQLVLALTQVIGKITEGIKSRTIPVFTGNTGNDTDAEFVFLSGYGNSPFNTIDMRGFLEQRVFRCTDDCKPSNSVMPGVCDDSLMISNKVNDQSEPAPVVALIDGVSEPLNELNANITPEKLGIPTPTASEPLLNLLPTNDWVTEGTQELSTDALVGTEEEIKETYKEQLIDLILGNPDSRRAKTRMGAIRTGNPTVIGRPAYMGDVIPSYTLFRKAQANRPTVLFAPTNTGELMAFRVDRPESMDEGDYGNHIWSVIPGLLVPRLQELADKTVFLLDGTPVVRDIRMLRTESQADPTVEVANWKSILMVGYGEGGRGFTALNVTDPTKPKFMWEITHLGRCAKNTTADTCATFNEGEFNNDIAENDFCHLGRATSKPILANVYLTEFDSLGPQERAVAVFGGGSFEESDNVAEATPCGTSTVFNEADIGKSFYVVDLATGRRIVEFRKGNGNVIGEDKLIYDITGSPACYNTSVSSVMTRCFVGDAGGQLWRIDLSTGDPSSWTMTMFHDAYAALPDVPRSPITNAPTLAVQPYTGRLVLIYGTGYGNYVSNATNDQAIYSLTEMVTLDSDGSIDPDAGVTAKVNWQLLFDDGTMLVGTPVVFDEVAYFTTYRPNPADFCSLEEDAAKLWGLDFYRSDADPADPDAIGNPLGALDVDGDPTTADTVESLDLGGLVPSGVFVVQMPVCNGEIPVSSDGMDGTEAAGADGGNSGGGGTMPVLSVQFQGKLGAPPPVPGDNMAEGGGIPTYMKKLRRPRMMVQPLAWTMVYD